MNGEENQLVTAEMVREWLVDRMAELLRCPRESIKVDNTFDRLGLDSATAVGVTLDLEDWLGRRVEPEVFYDHNTIRRLANHLGAAGTTDTPSGSTN